MQRMYYKSQASQARSRSNKSHKVYRRSETQWAAGFIENLIRIVHDQWTWRNEKLHFRKHPGAETASEYEQIMNRIMTKLEMTDPEDLLPEDQFLLGVDPEKLMNTSPDGRQAWLANLDSAIAAAGHEKRRRDETDDTESEDEDEEQSHHFRPPPVKHRCVFQAGRRWRNNLRQKRINKWKSFNFLGKHRVDDYLSDDTDNEASPDSLPTSPSSPPRSTKRQATMNKWLGHQRETSDAHSTTNQQLPSPSQLSSTNADNSSRANQPNSRQASMTNWLNQPAQRRTQTNPPPSSEDNIQRHRQPNPPLSSVRSQSFQNRPSPPSNENPNASASQQQLEPRRIGNIHLNLSRKAQDIARRTAALAAEGSQIFKRRRLK